VNSGGTIGTGCVSHCPAFPSSPMLQHSLSCFSRRLFLGTGRSLSTGGPASLLIAYTITGALVYLVMLCLGGSFPPPSPHKLAQTCSHLFPICRNGYRVASSGILHYLLRPIRRRSFRVHHRLEVRPFFSFFIRSLRRIDLFLETATSSMTPSRPLPTSPPLRSSSSTGTRNMPGRYRWPSWCSSSRST
jgi:hypothetical protein